MNVFTGWTGWAISAVLRYLGIRVGAPRDRVNDVLTKHEQRMRDELRLAGQLPVRAGLSTISERIERSWQQFVHAHEWPGSCPRCVWWVPSPSEAEDAIAVYRPCALHDPALWPEQEKKAGQ